MKIYLTILLHVFASISFYCASIDNGRLMLDVSLVRDESINIKSTGNIMISDTAGIYSKSFAGNISLSIVTPLPENRYVILTDPVSELSTSDSDQLFERQTIVWRDSSLSIDIQLYEYINMGSLAIANVQQYAREHSLKQTDIVNLCLENPSISIRDEHGKQFYFESPITITAHNPIRINDSDLAYSGEFVVKYINSNLQLNQQILLENYLAGVIQNEIGSNAPLEALKAQAVAARTHAVTLLLYNRHKNDGYDLCNSTHCQVYKGEYLLNQAILDAVLETDNQILIYDNKVIDAPYHSYSGGKTDSSQDIWRGSPLPYLMGVVSDEEVDGVDLTNEDELRAWINRTDYDNRMSSWERSTINWTRNLRIRQLEESSGVSNISLMKILKRGISGRILSLELHGTSVKRFVGESAIRRLFGGLPSSMFYIVGDYSINGNNEVSMDLNTNITIKGKGSGHGVGMCQLGALSMSRAGFSYEEILYKYYPGTQIRDNWIDNHE